MVVEAVPPAPASEEGSLSPSPQPPVAVDANVDIDGPVSPPADGSAAAVVSSDDTSGKEDAAEEGWSVGRPAQELSNRPGLFCVFTYSAHTWSVEEEGARVCSRE